MKALCRSLKTIVLAMTVAGGALGHVPHDIIYSLDPSPDFAETGMILASSTQFGECHMVSHNHGATFSESHRGIQERSLALGHTYSPNFSKDGIVFMAMKKGYYKSTDRAENWVKQPAFGHEPVLNICLASDFTKTGKHYVLTSKGVFLVSKDGVAESLLPKDEVTFGKIIISGGKLYVHCVYYKKQKMIKGMEHIDYLSGTVDVLNLKTGKWSALSTGVDGAVIADFDISGQNQVVSLKDGSIWLKGAGGGPWKKVFSRDNGDFASVVKFSPEYADDGVLIAGTAWGFTFMSEDGGRNWELRSNGQSRWVHHFDILTKSIVFSPDYKNDQTIMMGKTTGFYKTTDNGRYWRHINIWNQKWGYYALPAPGGSQDVFTACYNGGISRSSDNGSTWESANIGITAGFANGMVLSPNYENDHSIFVVDIATGPYRSTDGGRSWGRIPELDPKKLHNQPTLFRELGISNDFKEDGTILVFLVPRHILGKRGANMVFKFNDKTKEVKRVNVVKSGRAYVNSFAFDPAGSKLGRMFCASSSGVSMSTDKGDTWKMIFTDVGIQQIFISPNVDQDGTLYLMDKDGKIHRSTDNGKSFQMPDMNLGGQYVNNLTFSPTYNKDHAIYVTTFGEGVLKSTDNGKTWVPFGLKGKFLYTGLTFSADYEQDQTIFAPAVDGIFRSTDNGKTWKNVLDHSQLLPKEVFFTVLDPKGKEIPQMLQAVKLMKEYGMYDEEVVKELYGGKKVFKKMFSPHAYLATYYTLNGGPGYMFEIDFYGYAAELKCMKGPNMGLADIVVDGEKVATVDLYAETETFDVTVYNDQSMELKEHFIQIVETGKKNSKSSGTAVNFNALNIKN
ncbi:VPS10 domain-containing protein [Pontiella agarivorans]|uniref:Sortilin N-terminal domain-containing protein n=1 Tax=Pontiella agarivorans TaxID=3038953 RepID=A0ABU5MY57_9BACT|nr:hypothetical protein [Pontiella agarivorans]MDZ8119100.1 hypothetical protein [Pontiella agarivorans]